jgi:aspartyl-tRNA(Asn)/glutamyl-tRNA(Gln) amidotransferase subunit C
MKTVKKTAVDKKVVSHIAKLANLTLPEAKLAEATAGFSSVLEYVSKVQKVDTKNVKETGAAAPTGTWREDVIDTSRTLTQEEALSNAPQKHNGYFVVNSILSE